MDFKNILIGDFHLHSRFSRACSKNITIPELVKWARVKGIGLLGTSDFTHPIWLEEIKKYLKPGDKGFYYYEDDEGKFPFIISGEISLMYTQERGRRIHVVVLVPSLEVADEINKYFDTKGRRDYDGRPIFKIPGDEFVKDLRNISKDIEIIPAHCLVKGSLIHTLEGVKNIESVKIGDSVLTHKGRYNKVSNVLNRPFKGEVIKIIPSCLRKGTFFTPEHPIYSIKSHKDCKNSFHTICKPTCAYLKKGCKIKKFETYKKEWVQCKDLERGDIILYPRYNKIKDKNFLFLSEFVKGYVEGNFIKPRKEKIFVKNIPVNNKINVSEDFCRLMGYYLAEGYCTKDHISFTFNAKEKDYIEDVQKLLIEIFGPSLNIKIKKEKSKAITLQVYSKLLFDFFKTFYLEGEKRSYNKALPSWFLNLPHKKLKQLLIGWWRGDTGNTTSLILFNQFKEICLKLGILPSISVISAEEINKRRLKRPNFIGDRRIVARKDLFVFDNLLFFEENLDLLGLDEFKKFKTKLSRRRAWVDKDYFFIPIFKIEKKEYFGNVYNLEVEGDNSYVTENLIAHNCWTPWFGIFGSKSGFDSLKECFKDEIKHIHAIETGISSDPPMNWRIKELEHISIVSFSDAHSFWPWRLGREATLFKKTDSYFEIIKQIRKNSFVGTIETDPGYGIYHYDGHRDCGFSCSPKETKELGGICPKCKRPLTIGVENRVEELAEYDEGFKHKKSKPFFKLLPLHEIISLYLGVGINAKKTWTVYNDLIDKFEVEFNILLEVSEKEFLEKEIDKKLIKLILRNRDGKIKVKPGYDGVYGKPILDEGFEKQGKLV